MHRGLTVSVPLLRMWVHCPRASNGLLPRRSNLVGYVRWDAQSDRFPPWSSSRAPLLVPSPLRTVRDTFASHGSSTQKRPHEKRGRGLMQNESDLLDTDLRPTRTAMEKSIRRVGSRTNGFHRRHLLCFLHRFHKRSRVSAPARSGLRFRRGPVVPTKRRDLYLPHYGAAFAFSRAPMPAPPLSTSRFSTPHRRVIRVYPVPLN